MSECPTEQQLSDLVNDRLSDSRVDELTEHVGTCEVCQETMQRLAAGDLAFDSLLVGSVAAVPPKESQYWDVRNSIANNPIEITAISQSANTVSQPTRFHPGGSGNGTDGRYTANVDLSFLSPSDNPAFLGRLQQFDIVRVLGHGGMGVVLQGFDPHLQRTVAIKVLHAKYQQDDAAIERFCREGRAAAAISHEHVVQMYQVARVEEGEMAFLVMQMIEGETLESLLKQKSPLQPNDVARIGMQAAAGLSAAHERGLVHRDIKPGNIMIEDLTDRVKLTDFGLAWAGDDVRLTSTGMLLGTALYMSPEQALGKTVDERSDLFSLGAVMYEMATGQSPFTAPTAVGVMKKIMDDNPPPPRSINPEIKKPTSNLIMQLLAKSPDARPDSAGLVARALASVVSEQGPISPLQVPSVASSEVKKLSRRSKTASRVWSIGGWLLGLISLAVLIAMVSAGWSPLGYPTTENVDEVSVFKISDGVPTKDVTNEFETILLGGNPGAIWSIDFSNDGKTIAAGIGDGSVRIWDIEKQEVVRSFDAHSGNVWNVIFHPTKNLIATAGDDSWVKIRDLETFDAVQGWKLGNTVRAIAFSPDGKDLAAADRDGELHVYDINTGAERNTIKLPGTTILGIDYSPDGKSIVAAGSDKTVRIFDANTLEQRQDFDGHEGPIYTVVYSLAKKPLIASVGFKSDTWIWNPETGESVAKLQGSGGDNWAVGFCRDGNHLLTGGQDGMIKVWDTKKGKQIAALRGHTAAVHDFAFDPKHHRMASSSRDGTIRIWDTRAMASLKD